MTRFVGRRFRPATAAPAFLPRKIRRGATRRGRCDVGTPAGSAKRQFCGGSLPSSPLCSFAARGGGVLGRDLVDVEGLRGRRGCRCRCDSGRNLRLEVCLHRSCGIMGCKLGSCLAVIGRHGGSHGQGRPALVLLRDLDFHPAPDLRQAARLGSGLAWSAAGSRTWWAAGPLKGRTLAFGSKSRTPRRWPACHRNGRSAAEETPEGRLDTAAAGVVPLVRQPRRFCGRRGSTPAPASSATSGRS